MQLLTPFEKKKKCWGPRGRPLLCKHSGTAIFTFNHVLTERAKVLLGGRYTGGGKMRSLSKESNGWKPERVKTGAHFSSGGEKGSLSILHQASSWWMRVDLNKWLVDPEVAVAITLSPIWVVPIIQEQLQFPEFRLRSKADMIYSPLNSVAVFFLAPSVSIGGGRN